MYSLKASKLHLFSVASMGCLWYSQGNKQQCSKGSFDLGTVDGILSFPMSNHSHVTQSLKPFAAPYNILFCLYGRTNKHQGGCLNKVAFARVLLAGRID